MLHDTSVEPLSGELRTRQRSAADAVLNAFAMGDERQLVIMPCGTGKTHLAVHVGHELKADSRCLTVLPTLELLNQTARVWYSSGRRGLYVGFCSDDQTSEPILSDVLTMIKDPGELAAAARGCDGPVNVFITYQSLHKLPEAHLRHRLPRWDLIVVDEAHRTAGARRKPWAVIHNNDAIPARHRLYLTATPRIWDVERGFTTEPIASMDDVELFGRVGYRYSLAQAIAEGQLADYRIAAPEIHDAELRNVLVERAGARRTPQADALRVAVSQLALFKAREDHHIRRTVVFSRSIAQCDAFADSLTETAAGIPGGHLDNLWAASIHHRHHRRHRKSSITRFAEPQRPHHTGRWPDLNVLCNVRLCVEGVDFPLADSVLFADPKQSTIAIVQAVGRALRLAPGMNKKSTLIIPVFFGPGQRPEEATLGTPYHLLHQVMIALRAYDEHFFLRLPPGSHRRLLLPSPAPGIRPARAPEIEPHLMLRIMEPEPDLWEAGMAAAQAYFADHGDLDVPSNHIDGDGFHLGCWLGYQRALKAAGNLPAGRIAALATCNMIWSHTVNSSEAFLDLASAYAREHGHLLPHPGDTYQGRPLGEWLAEQRRLDTDGALPAPYRRALKDIDRWWNPSWPALWQRRCAFARSRSTKLAIPRGPLPLHADETTRWLDEQFDAFPALAKGQQAQLADLPLTHDPLVAGLQQPADHRARTHAQGLRAARRFYRRHQHLRPAADYRDPRTRFELGQWITTLRRLVAENALTREEIDALEALGMEWRPGLQHEDAPAVLGEKPAATPEGEPPGEEDPVAVPVATAPWSRQNVWLTGKGLPPDAAAQLLTFGGMRMLMCMPAGGGKTTTAARTVLETGTRACLILGPDRRYLQTALRIWRKTHTGPIAGFNMRPARGGKGGTRLSSEADLATWMARQPSGALVVATYKDAARIAASHRNNRLPPWDHLIVEEAHRTAEGDIIPSHPHAAIHYDDGILALRRLYLTATPWIPRVPDTYGEPQGDTPWTVNMPEQPIFGTFHRGVTRQDLVDRGLLSPYQLCQIKVPSPAGFPLWRAEAVGTAHLIEKLGLRRVVCVFEDRKSAEHFACQLATKMLDAEILLPPQTPTRFQHNQPVIRCQRIKDPTPPDIDALVFPHRFISTDLTNALSPLLGQHSDRVPQTTIIIPQAVDPADGTPLVPLFTQSLKTALWAHEPAFKEKTHSST